MISKVKMQEKIQKFQDFNICPNILHIDADAGGIALALLHLSAGMLKRSDKSKLFKYLIKSIDKNVHESVYKTLICHEKMCLFWFLAFYDLTEYIEYNNKQRCKYSHSPMRLDLVFGL